MAHSGSQHISNILGSKDIPSLQLWLKKVGASMPDISTVERKIMESQKAKYVPKELKGRITKNLYKKKDTEPDWKGNLMYKGEIINFGAWLNTGPYGEYFSLQISNPDWKKDVTPDVPSHYSKDSDVPF